MEIYIDQFREYLVNIKKVSVNTQEAYIRDVLQFVSYCTMNGAKTLKKINSSFVEKYCEYLRFLGKSDSTVSRIVASLRCYFKHLVSKSYC